MTPVAIPTLEALDYLKTGLGGFEDLAAGLRWSGSEWLVSVWAYFDESGHPGDPNVHGFVVGGCVARVESWRTFDQEWSSVLGDFNLRWFHMRDFAHRRGPFNEWSEDRRRALLGQLIGLMTRYVDDFVGTKQRFSGDRPRPDLDALYYSHYRTCIFRAAPFNRQERVEFMFARHAEISPQAFTDYHGLLLRVLSGDERWQGRLGTVTVGDPRDYAPLQAADLVAYELFQALKSPGRLRWPLAQLSPRHCHFYDLGSTP